MTEFAQPVKRTFAPGCVPDICLRIRAERIAQRSPLLPALYIGAPGAPMYSL